MATEASHVSGNPGWQPPLTPARSPRWHDPNWHPGKGQRGGECQRVACDNRNAYWFNQTNGQYYCSSCARTFNEVSRRNGQPPLCELHAPA